MNLALTFDTHAYVKRFKAVGFTDPQAEEVVSALSEVRDARLEELATKGDLKQGLQELEVKIAEAKSETIKWIVTLSLAQLGLLTGMLFTIIRLLPTH